MKNKNNIFIEFVVNLEELLLLNTHLLERKSQFVKSEISHSTEGEK